MKDKLVTPVFYQSGVTILNDKVIVEERVFDEELDEYRYDYFTALLKDVWEKILTEKTLMIQWEKQVKEKAE